MSDKLLRKLRSQKWTADYKDGVRELKALSELASARGSVSDTERVEWLMRKISGKEARRLGIIYSAGLTRQDIDEAIKRTPNEKVSV